MEESERSAANMERACKDAMESTIIDAELKMQTDMDQVTLDVENSKAEAIRACEESCKLAIREVQKAAAEEKQDTEKRAWEVTRTAVENVHNAMKAELEATTQELSNARANLSQRDGDAVRAEREADEATQLCKDAIEALQHAKTQHQLALLQLRAELEERSTVALDKAETLRVQLMQEVARKREADLSETVRKVRQDAANAVEAAKMQAERSHAEALFAMQKKAKQEVRHV